MNQTKYEIRYLLCNNEDGKYYWYDTLVNSELWLSNPIDAYMFTTSAEANKVRKKLMEYPEYDDIVIVKADIEMKLKDIK